MRLPPTPLLLAALLGLSQCKHTDPAPPKPEDQLPPATQTGANTFGCLLNGQPWLPTYGLTGLTGPFRVSYDPGYLGGALQIKVNRYPVSNSNALQTMTIGVAYVDKIGVYQFPLHGINSLFYGDTSNNSSCGNYGDPRTSTYQIGTLTISRLDLTKGIISGTFTVTLAQPGCDTLKVTQGRFDKQL